MYTQKVYIKMNFFEQTTIVCEHCNKKAEKKIIVKNSFKIRGWQCTECKRIWLHPLDEAHYNEFQRLRHKDFQVKLRMVGNSWTVSIPKEIIEFENLAKEMDKMIKLSLESPDRIVIMLRKEIVNLIKEKED